MTDRLRTGPRSNRILAALSTTELEDLKPTTRTASVAETLFGPDSNASQVIFPHDGSMLSLVRTVEDGMSVEVGVVGAEGATPLSSVLASLPVVSQCVVQIAGAITVMRADEVRAAFMTHERFRNAVLVSTKNFHDQVSQHVVCNRLHSLEQRLAKWLLLTRDRAGKDQLDLTHDLLAHVLGVYRPGVTVALTALSLDGAISHTRGIVVVENVEMLERRACECRGVLHDSWQSLMM